MDEKQYKFLKAERLYQARRELWLSWQPRGYASIHKRNIICVECRKAYNTNLECPIHKTPLLVYIGELPRKRNLKAWKRISENSHKLSNVE